MAHDTHSDPRSRGGRSRESRLDEAGRRNGRQTATRAAPGAQRRRPIECTLALVATVLLASVAVAQAPHTRRTYTVIGLRDCALVVDGARALGLIVTRTDDPGTCKLTVTGPLPKMRAIDATVDDLTDSGGCAAPE